MDDEDDGYPDTSKIPEDECCMCGSYEITVTDPFGYPFCEHHEQQADFLAKGRANNWPALQINGITGKYAIDNDLEAWLFNAFFATDERIVELLDALDEYEVSLRLAS